MTERVRQWVTIVLSLIFIGIANITFSSWAIGQNNQRWCSLLAVGTEPPPRAPAGVAQTPVGEDLQRYNRELAAQQARKLALVRKLQRDYHC